LVRRKKYSQLFPVVGLRLQSHLFFFFCAENILWLGIADEKARANRRRAARVPSSVQVTASPILIWFSSEKCNSALELFKDAVLCQCKLSHSGAKHRSPEALYRTETPMNLEPPS